MAEDICEMNDENIFNLPERSLLRIYKKFQVGKAVWGLFWKPDFIGKIHFAVFTNHAIGGTAEIKLVLRIVYCVLCKN